MLSPLWYIFEEEPEDLARHFAAVEAAVAVTAARPASPPPENAIRDATASQPEPSLPVSHDAGAASASLGSGASGGKGAMFDSPEPDPGSIQNTENDGQQDAIAAGRPGTDGKPATLCRPGK